jgi:hypothetical protein
VEGRACYFSLFLNETRRKGEVYSAWFGHFAFEKVRRLPESADLRTIQKSKYFLESE